MFLIIITGSFFLLLSGLFYLFIELYPAYFLIIERFYLSYFLLVIGFSTLTIVLSFIPVLTRKIVSLANIDSRIFESPSVPEVGIIIPAYNEEVVVLENVHNLLGNQYPHLRITVINDGSTDNTKNLLIKEFHFQKEALPMVHPGVESKEVLGTYRSLLHNNLFMVDKVNGGSKADANNAGIRFCPSPLMAFTDADTVVTNSTFFRLTEPFIYSKENYWGVGGAVLLKNNCHIKQHQVISNKISKSWLVRFQTLEYIRSFLYGRIGLNSLGGNFIVSGAFGLFTKEAVSSVNGYNSKAIGEDIDLVMRMHRYMKKHNIAGKIHYIPDPVCYTEAPEDLATLQNQRDRWQRGLIYSLYQHREIFFNPKYGLKGWVVYPYYFFIEMLSPLIEFSAYAFISVLLYRGSINVPMGIFFLAAAFLSGLMMNVHALMLDTFSFQFFKGFRFKSILYLAAFLENFGYHQMTVLFRVHGTLKYIYDSIRRKESGWGKMKRVGS